MFCAVVYFDANVLELDFHWSEHEKPLSTMAQEGHSPVLVSQSSFNSSQSNFNFPQSSFNFSQSSFNFPQSGFNFIHSPVLIFTVQF